MEADPGGDQILACGGSVVKALMLIIIIVSLADDRRHNTKVRGEVSKQMNAIMYGKSSTVQYVRIATNKYRWPKHCT